MRIKTFISGRDQVDEARRTIHLDYQVAPSRSRQKWTPEEMFALHVRKVLMALARHRQANGTPIGNLTSWVTVAADISAALHGAVTERTVEAMCVRMGIPLSEKSRLIIAPIAARAAASQSASGYRSFKMMDGETVGQFVELTSKEREALGIKKIGAVDESKDDRRKRLNRERQASRRSGVGGGGVSKTPLPASATKPWEEYGISRSLWYAEGFNKLDKNVTLSVLEGKRDKLVQNPGKRDGKVQKQRDKNSPDEAPRESVTEKVQKAEYRSKNR